MRCKTYRFLKLTKIRATYYNSNIIVLLKTFIKDINLFARVLPNGEKMQIFLFNITNQTAQSIPFEKLSERAKTKFLSLQKNAPLKAVQTAIADLMLTYIRTIYNIDGELKQTPQGKPYFENSQIYFSISHSDKVVAISCDSENNGLDMQLLTPIDNSVAEKCLNQAELLEYKNADENVKIKLFAKHFSEKESYVKYLGTGFTSSPCEIKNYGNAKFLTKYIFLGNQTYCITACAQNITHIKYTVLLQEQIF